ncbi:MAG: SPOR domain-containing protein [Acidobacteriaceae bacterium]|nr:SPOR domain-containing protein [Acidobacteriaceae bacterium]
MLRSSESETEILLGNKQLLAIFFVVAILLGIAFTSGYMIGRNGSKKAPQTAVADATPAAAPAGSSTSGGETHAVSPSDSSFNDASNSSQTASDAAAPEEPPLGTPKKKTAAAIETAGKPATAPDVIAQDFVPGSGQEFLQVAAVAKPDANEVADVLRKKGFPAHAVPAPHNPNLYRVLVGPIRDAGDLASTRDLLRKTGFREVIVQRYR